MAKDKAKKKEKEETAEREYVIIGAELKDGVCNYSYRITEGTGLGDIHTVKGVGIFEEDLSKAFGKLNAHMACIDDAFGDIESIKKMHNDPLTAKYEVGGINIKGDENEAVILKATKQITCSGERLEIKTPKIPIDNLSSYKFWKDLRDSTELVREEVALYKEGKCTNPEPEVDENQLTIADAMGEDEEEFENGKV